MLLFILQLYSISEYQLHIVFHIAAAEEDREDGTPKKKHKKSSLTQESNGTGQKNTIFSFVKPGLSNTQSAAKSGGRKS